MTFAPAADRHAAALSIFALDAKVSSSRRTFTARKSAVTLKADSMHPTSR